LKSIKSQETQGVHGDKFEGCFSTLKMKIVTVEHEVYFVKADSNLDNHECRYFYLYILS